jgi:hypothetical protein
VRGYDHRGHCLNFEHSTLGELGKIVLIKIREGQMLIQAELFKGQEDVNSPLVKQKKQVFEQVVATVNHRFDENFPVEKSASITGSATFGHPRQLPHSFTMGKSNKYKFIKSL